MTINSVRRVLPVLAVALAILTVGTVPAQRICCQGDIWLKWSHQERKTYVWGFSTAYARGYESACRRMDKLWTAPLGAGPEDAPLNKCLAGEIGLSRSVDYYVQSVTEFYRKYPDDRSIGMEEVLEQLAKGLTIEQIHDYPFWRRGPHAPKQ